MIHNINMQHAKQAIGLLSELNRVVRMAENIPVLSHRELAFLC
jgi:hypothetical protein